MVTQRPFPNQLTVNHVAQGQCSSYTKDEAFFLALPTVTNIPALFEEHNSEHGGNTVVSLKFTVSSNCRPQKKFKSSWGGICAFSSILRQCQGTLQAKPPWSKAEEAGETEPPRRMFWPCSGRGPVTRTLGQLSAAAPAKTGPEL